MTATEKAKRSDALYYETVSVNRRVLCDMVANREADLEDARAENAALLEECDGWKKLCVDQEVIHVMHEEMLDAENAKLRELCADMLSEDMDQHWPEFTRRARELGVEVDE